MLLFREVEELHYSAPYPELERGQNDGRAITGLT